MNDPQTTVFVVDSDAPSRNVVRDVVGRMDLRCRTYASGQRFLEECDRSAPGCLVCEVQVPDVGGLEIQRRLAVEGASLPVIFLTAHATIAIAVRAMREGAVHFLEKPLQEDELWETIQKAVRLDRQHRQISAEKEQMKRRLADLTPGELDVWRLWVHDEDTGAIAEKLGISVRAVESRQNSALRKLGIRVALGLLPLAAGVFDDELRGVSELVAAGAVGAFHWNRDFRRSFDMRIARDAADGER